MSGQGGSTCSDLLRLRSVTGSASLQPVELITGRKRLQNALFSELDDARRRSAKIMPEKPLHDVEATSRLEPARIDVLTGNLPDLVAELNAKAEGLGRALHPRTAANLADLVRLMNTYYSNLIEGHNLRPRDIERALAGERDDDKRDLQQEAVSHYRVQERIDIDAARGDLADPAAPDFLRQFHRDFYDGASPEMLTIRAGERQFVMAPGEWRKGAGRMSRLAATCRPPASGCRPSWTISIFASPSSQNLDA